MSRRVVVPAVVMCVLASVLGAGPYNRPGVNGYIDPGERWRAADPLSEPNAVLNPIFRGWATGYMDYLPADEQWSGPGVWNDPSKAVGPATGDNFDIVSLGELDADEIAQGAEPGRITLVFGTPGDGNAIRNGPGYDFAVFENAFVSLVSTPLGSVAGRMLAELAYVEVSSNGVDFVRFPSVSLTAGPVGPYGTIEISDVYNLAGKHPNAAGLCTGTGFDLDEVAGEPLVLDGTVDINEIRYVRVVDIPGSGDFYDGAEGLIDPATGGLYGQNHRVYDAWPTFGSGGFDLEAVGVLHAQRYSADIDLNGMVDLFDFALLASAWGSRFGQRRWVARADLAESGGLVVDGRDLAEFAAQWLAVEKWRADASVTRGARLP